MCVPLHSHFLTEPSSGILRAVFCSVCSILRPLWASQQQQQDVQVVNPSSISHDCGKSSLSMSVYHPCNALRMLDPIAGAIILRFLTCTIIFVLKSLLNAKRMVQYIRGSGHTQSTYVSTSMSCRWDTGSAHAHDSIPRHLPLQGRLRVQCAHSTWSGDNHSLGS